MAAYQAHDRVVAADSKPAATLVLLQDWWRAWQQADHDPAQEVVVLAARRAEVDRLNTLCQELLATQGRLGSERLQVEDRQLAVGDRSSVATTPSPSWGWPTAAAAPSPPSTRRPEA